MANLIVYGSLMSLDELARHGALAPDLSPVTVLGFRRSFHQEPVWRRGNGLARGVLTVSKSDQASFNGVMIRNLSESALALFDHRERGYDRWEIPATQIEHFDLLCSNPVASSAFLYVGKTERYNRALLPNADYLRRCHQAASEWGASFRIAFVDNTYIGPSTLRDHLGNDDLN
ncbi:gamma-glutamylcyclotransferase [Roseiconus nitratireducens]|uniref:Gamma-glutamylcyclotransferase n=1 Tax=Roseiconus nitratireducens TaxID=2605748 RepID=A0A5M6DGB2_9BACT|nr:gamma-glutamylcyclotransferase family protein [Roseiconus nitratireducens]KAA5545446.1 gamma-glutamylcyclotransferase [Roseiconus nitratireducens]